MCAHREHRTGNCQICSPFVRVDDDFLEEILDALPIGERFPRLTRLFAEPSIFVEPVPVEADDQ